MKVLAIDPGPKESAYVHWDGAIILLHGKLPNAEVRDAWRDVECRCVIEMIQHYGSGMPAGASVFDTCIWIGRYLEAWGHADLLFRREVKLHLCGSVKAKDGNIRQALIDRLGAPGTKKQPGLTYGISGDCWQALALAVTWWDKHNAPPARATPRPEDQLQPRPF